MEVFQCAPQIESVPPFSGPCDSKMKPDRLKYCRHVLAAWALGAKVRALRVPWVLARPPERTRPTSPPPPTLSLPPLLGREGFFQSLWLFYKNAKFERRYL